MSDVRDRGRASGLTPVAILGPGAVGGTLAVRLARAGMPVVVVATPASAAAIRADGITLVAPGGSSTERVDAVERLVDPVALLLVAVKQAGLETALERVATEPERVVPLLNGLEHMELLRTRFGDAVAAGSVGRFEGYRESPTRIVQTTPGMLLTTSSPTTAELLGVDGIETRTEGNDRLVLWEKAARLAPVTAVSALTQRPIGELRADAEWRPVLEAAVVEACALATADGAPVTPAEQWAMIDRMPATLLTSAARDVAAGRPSELDAIVGGVVRAGERLGVPTPTLARLLAQLEGK
jgi:2-dehydropantoate 2-reductase